MPVPMSVCKNDLAIIDISPWLPQSCSLESTPALEDSDLSHPNPEQKLVERKRLVAIQINEAFSSQGFLYITGHGVAQSLIDAAVQYATKFFALPEAEKQQSVYQAPVPRGYIGVNKENFACLVGEKQPNDLVEKLRFGPMHITSDSQLANLPAYYQTKEARQHFFPNQMPVCPANAEPLLRQYYDAMGSVAQTLMQIFEQALGVPTGFLVSRMDKHPSILSFNNYPVLPEDQPVSKGQLRIAKHTDIDVFTILHQEDQPGGLEVLLPSSLDKGGKEENKESWVGVPYVQGTLVINIGDCLSHWTGGAWKSTYHRVVLPLVPTSRVAAAGNEKNKMMEKNKKVEDRKAIGFFVALNYDALLSPLPRATSGYATDYVTMTYAQWRKQRIKRAMQQLKNIAK